jgi:phage tail-like protein
MQKSHKPKRIRKGIPKELKMTATGSRNDPYRKHNFIVEIDGIASSGFHSVEGMETVTEVVDYREGSESTKVRKLPGLRKYANITLKRGFTGDRDLWEWRKTVIDGRTERRAGSIVILDEVRQEVSRINFRDAWPCRWGISGLNAEENEPLIEEIELVVEDLFLDE